MTLPRGIRNNNPLNIRDDGRTPWQGLDDPRGDGQFLRFIKPEYGYRAGVKILRSYRARGIVTVGQIVSTWAPKTENATDKYIESVLKSTGWPTADFVPAESEGDYLPLMQAMAKLENGAAYLAHPSLALSVIGQGQALA